MTAVGVGALSAGIYLASRRSVRGLSGVILTGTVLFGLGLAGFSMASRVEVAAVMLVIIVIGFAADKALFSPWERFLRRRWGLTV